MPLDKPNSKTYCPVLFDTIYSSNKDDSYQLCCYARPSDLSRKFNQAHYHLNYLTLNDNEWAKKYENQYQSVKPILDDSIDKLLGKTK